MHRLSDRVRKYTRKDKRNEINTSNMAAEAYARSTAKFNDFKRDGIFRNHNYVRASAFNGLTSRNTSKSIGESNAVFLRGVGGDAATEPHKSGCWGYPEEEFSGTHKLVYKNHGVLSRRELSVKLPKLARKTFIR